LTNEVKKCTKFRTSRR